MTDDTHVRCHLEGKIAAFEVAKKIAEEERSKILNDPHDPSWTEHLAHVQTNIDSLIWELKRELKKLDEVPL